MGMAPGAGMGGVHQPITGATCAPERDPRTALSPGTTPRCGTGMVYSTSGQLETQEVPLSSCWGGRGVLGRPGGLCAKGGDVSAKLDAERTSTDTADSGRKTKQSSRDYPPLC